MAGNEEVQSLLSSAVKRGESEKVEELVDQYGLSDSCGGYALLSYATMYGHKWITKFLLEAGAMTNGGISRSAAPLHFAAWFGDSELAQLLLDHRARINAKDAQQETPLHLACRKGHENVVQLLLDKGANINAVRELPATLKEKFVDLKVEKTAFASTSRFKELVNHGAKVKPQSHENDPNCNPGAASNRKFLRKFANIFKSHNKNLGKRKSEVEGNITPLHLAAEMGHLKIVDLLLKNGASVDPQTSKGSTPLILAVVEGHVDVAKMLLDCGASVFTRGNDDWNSLCLAVQRGDVKMVKCLLDHGAIAFTSAPDFSASHFAVGNGYKEIVESLLDSGCSIHDKDQFGNSLIVYSMMSYTKSGHAETLQLLSDRGADLREVPNLFHNAVKLRNIDVCKVLLKNGVDINVRGTHVDQVKLSKYLTKDLKNCNFGTASESEREERDGYHPAVGIAGKRLFFTTRNVANKKISRKDTFDGSTPLHVACRQGCVEMIEFLLNNEANIEARQADGKSPLEIAVERKRVDLVKILLWFHADVNAQEASNNTALHKAAMMSLPRIVEILLDNGSDVHIVNSDGKTAFELSISGTLSQSSIILCEELMSDEPNLDLTRSIFKNHLVKLKVLGAFVHEKLLQLLDLDSELEVFQKKCEEEISRMKNNMLLDHYILHRVFMKQRNPSYMRNKSLVDLLETFDYSNYPIYKNMLQITFRKSKERIELLDAGIKSLRILMKTQNTLNVVQSSILSDEMLEEVVSLLDRKDLQNLICCSESLKRQLQQT